MSINPSTQYPGKVAPDANYPYGKAQNITSPGDGTGTPWEAALVNDIFGFQQFLMSKAGITPSGTPDNATTSQYFEAVWGLLNVRALTYNIVSNTDLTLTPDQNLYTNLTITDTGVVLTTGRNIIMDNVGRIFTFTNSTAQILTVKTAAGTGVAIPVGGGSLLINDGVNVTTLTTLAPTTDYGIVNKKYVDDKFANNPAFRATGASQAFTANVFTKLACSTEQLDNTAAYDSVTNYRFTPHKAGWYHVEAQMQSVVGNFGAALAIYKNGADYQRLQGILANTITDSLSGSCMVYLNGTTDYIEAYGSWTSNNNAITVFNAHYILGV